MSRLAVLGFLIALVCAPQATPQATAQTSEWASVGVRVAYREIVTPIGPRKLPQVTAVQLGGPAAHAGVRPGDAITFVRCGPFTFNYIDGHANGTTHFPAYESAGKADLPPSPGDAASRCRAGQTGLVSLMLPPGDTRKFGQFEEFRNEDSKGGAWSSSRADIDRIVTASNDDLKRQLALLRQQAPEAIRASGCSKVPTNPYNLAQHHPIVGEMNTASIKLGGNEGLDFWRDVAEAFCSIERRGPLPQLEAAIYQISRGKLDPCKYDPNERYGDIPVNYERRERPLSRDEYENYTRFDQLLSGLLDAQQTDCLRQLLRRSLAR